MPTLTAGNASVSITPSGGTAVTADFARARATLGATLIDTTPVDSAFIKNTAGNLDARASLECYYSTGVHGSIAEALEAGTSVTCTIAWASGKQISGQGLIESIEWDLAPNGVAMATITVRYCNGATTVVG